MEKNNNISFNAQFDRKLIGRKGKSVRYLVIEVHAPDKTIDRPSNPKPLNLAVVIDASGSMQGPRLAAARDAAIGVVRSLSDHDILSVISFSDDVITHVECLPCNEDVRQEAILQIGQLTSRHTTNLAAGWLQGSECVAKGIDKGQDLQHRVILLSDGYANQGITEPAQLGSFAQELRERGIFSTTVGIGDDYSPEQIQAIADFGGGRMHDAERPEEIIEVLLAELRELFLTTAENVIVEAAFPPGVSIKNLNGYPASVEANRIGCALGSLSEGALRRVVFRIRTPEGQEGDILTFQIKIKWRRPGSNKAEETSQISLVLTLARGRYNSIQPRNMLLSQYVAEVWQSQIIKEVVQLNRQGRYDKAADYILRKMKFFQRYCQDLPEGTRLIGELERTAQRITRPMQERSRKEIHLAHYKQSRNEMDHRTNVRRPRWDNYLKDDPKDTNN